MLIFFQVKRGYSSHRSGDYIANVKEFSCPNFIEATEEYANMIKHDLTNGDWEAIFNAVRQIELTRTRDAKIRAGISVKQREPLLPADPPTP